MAWQNIRNCGYFIEWYCDRNSGTGGRKTPDFLNSISSELARTATRFFDNIGDWTFAYGERQFGSIILPSLDRLGYSALQEIPASRMTKDNQPSTGWMDYWVQKNGDDRWVYFIELKHEWYYLNGSLTQQAADSLNKAVEQLKSLDSEEIMDLSATEKTIGVALLILPFYTNITDEEVCEEDEAPVPIWRLEESLEKIKNESPSHVTWIGGWSPPNRLQTAFQSSVINGLRSFPGVAYVASKVSY